VRGKKKDT